MLFNVALKKKYYDTYFNMKDILKSYRKPILIGLPDSYMDIRTGRFVIPNLDWLCITKFEGPRLFYLMDNIHKSHGFYPIGEEGYYGLAQKIKKIFNPEKITFGGAEIKIRENYKKPSRALENTILEMKNYFHYRIDKRYCFQWRYCT
jgi:hypothetical protein